MQVNSGPTASNANRTYEQDPRTRGRGDSNTFSSPPPLAPPPQSLLTDEQREQAVEAFIEYDPTGLKAEHKDLWKLYDDVSCNRHFSPPMKALCEIPYCWLASLGRLSPKEMAHALITKIVSRDEDIDEKDLWGTTALSLMAKMGRTDIASLLLENGADVNAQDNRNCSVLTGPASNGKLDMVKLLLSYNPHLNTQNKDGGTALIEATNLGHLEIVILLIEHGADTSLKHNDGRTAWERARHEILVACPALNPNHQPPT